MLNYWTQIAFSLAPLIAIVSWLVKLRLEGGRIRSAFKAEMIRNSILFFSAFPEDSGDGNFMFDLTHAVAVASRSFRFDIWETYQSQIHTLRHTDQLAVLNANNNFLQIVEVGRELLELLKIEERNEKERNRVSRHVADILLASKLQKELLTELSDRGFFHPFPPAALKKDIGSLPSRMQAFREATAKLDSENPTMQNS